MRDELNFIPSGQENRFDVYMIYGTTEQINNTENWKDPEYISYLKDCTTVMFFDIKTFDLYTFVKGEGWYKDSALVIPVNLDLTTP